MALGKCESCELPKIVARMQALRDTADMASANVELCDVVTTDNPYLKERDEALKELEEKRREFAEFVNAWRGVCLPVKKCEYGA